MKQKSVIVLIFSILVGIVVFMVPVIPLFFILIGIIFPVVSFLIKESPFKSLIYIIISLTSCYVIAPLLLHEKFLPTIADTVSFPEHIGEAFIIGVVFAGAPYLGTALILQIIKSKKN